MSFDARVLHQAPKLEAADAVRLARDAYGLTASAAPLPSERDQNFALDTDRGRFVLKIANAAEPLAQLTAQNAALARVAAGGGRSAKVVATADGREIAEHDGHFVRLLTWVPGATMGSITHHSSALVEDLGRELGVFDRALSDFDEPAAHRAFQWDLATALETIHARLDLVADRAWRQTLAVQTAAIAQRCDFAALRRSVIHNDVNDYNVIVADADDVHLRYQRVAGIIDFGDLVFSYTAADPAVAIAYAVLDKPDPLRVAVDLVRGYHRSHQLQPIEMTHLWDLVVLRLCLSACLAADQERQRPDDEYLKVSQGPIRRTLSRLVSVHPRFAEAAFRQACELPPSPQGARVMAWLRGDGSSKLRTNVIDGAGDAPEIDLSVGSPLVSGDAASNAEPSLTPRIFADIARSGAALAVGGYGEARSLYSSTIFAGATESSERRTIHMGVDLFASPGTPIRAPLAGRVHLCADNRAPLDYGPVVILEHETTAGDRFFTLYGHLTRESIAALSPGQQIDAGVAFAAIGSADVNGGWTPHLHLQIIVDLLGLDADFPGVCRPSEWNVWQSFSPDPNVLLARALGDGDTVADDRHGHLASDRRTYTGGNLSVSYRKPVAVARGWMQYLYDDNGRRLLDCYNNVPHVGHGHPDVVGAVARQSAVLNTNTRYLHDGLTRLAARLTATLPSPLRKCFFVNSGSEANELALRLARTHTRRHDVIVLESAYHGNTTTLIDISPYKFEGPGGSGRKPWVHVAPLPDVYRGPFRTADSHAATRYADAVAQIAEDERRRGSGIAAFIAETCPSVGGQIVFPRGYLAGVYRHVRDTGGVCIADEVQTAYGRMGTGFYAFEEQDVVPDIVVLGKPIGNGYPLGAVITTEEIAASFDNGMEYFSTFGGSTASCAAGLAVLDVTMREQLQAHAARVGKRLFDGLRSLAATHAIVGDVRGSGLFAGVELVRNPESLEPATAEADYVVNRLREEGVLIGTDGPWHNVLKIRPPMPFGDGDCDLLIATLDRVLGELER